MDISTIIGLVMAIGLVLGSIMMGGGLGDFIDVPSLMITVGGSIAAVLINFQLKVAMGAANVVKKCFLVKVQTPDEVISQFREFATTARRDGLLALEGEVENIDDDFLKRGLEQVVGGTSKEDLSVALETEVAAIMTRHSNGKKIVDAVAAAAPAFGMIGTLIGLVQMLKSLDDPSQIGGGMAVALLTTLYGAVIANMFCIPLAGKLEVRSQEELMIRELMIAGLVSLVEGQAPRALEERLLAYLSPKSRETATQQAA
ncbi:motility protein A [Fuerstiella marisgermanici]|uniref:Chemotaxis protein PomA n=1 Tax=Fuerstiella marisgermanici TaxID=1891926 RepID=A0A1P8WJB2_9PLAN|nr:MotA/TolQ/ExbB proton channel family protein [Fuerstiella marisgermanici]APZ94128.1 Chemotaxis protein PomA [Fuerstiella marisgermanici]